MYLCTKLGMTLAQIREQMSNEEFSYWSMYYRRIAQRQELEHKKGGSE